jgi:hypothetical protein
VVIKSDSLELIQACNAEIEIWSPYSVILDDCFMLAHSFDEFVFSIAQEMQIRWRIK